jgi:hypothetical protein
VPAAAVIPAPIAYIKVVAVKKLVVGSQLIARWSAFRGYCLAELPTDSSFDSLNRVS